MKLIFCPVCNSSWLSEEYCKEDNSYYIVCNHCGHEGGRSIIQEEAPLLWNDEENPEVERIKKEIKEFEEKYNDDFKITFKNKKKMIKFKVHSVIDVITNSSTEIYSWYDGSVSACKEMINEFIKTFGIEDKTADDIFYIDVFLDSYDYTDFMDKDTKEIEQMIKDVLCGKIKKPQGFIDAEKSYNKNGNYFYIEPKSEDYKSLVDAIKKLLNSPTYDAYYNG